MPAPISVTPENVESVLSDLPRLVRLALGFGSRLRRGTLAVPGRAGIVLKVGAPVTFVNLNQTGLTIDGQEFAAGADELIDAAPAGVALN